MGDDVHARDATSRFAQGACVKEAEQSRMPTIARFCSPRPSIRGGIGTVRRRSRSPGGLIWSGSVTAERGATARRVHEPAAQSQYALAGRVGQVLDLCGGDLHPAHLDVGATGVAIEPHDSRPVEKPTGFMASVCVSPGCPAGATVARARSKSPLGCIVWQVIADRALRAEEGRRLQEPTQAPSQAHGG
jgi:hypothetical protein